MELATGAMGMLPSMVLELLKDEYKLQTGARAEVQSLSRDLESMHVALRKVALAPPDLVDEQLLLWARHARDASYDIEDVLDSFLIRIDHQDSIQQFFGKAKARHEIAGAIHGIKRQLREMTERRQMCKVDTTLPAVPHEARVDPRLSALYTEASQLVGIHEQKDALIEMLSVGDDAKELKIVSVVGFGGLGKTTLAKAVYDKLSPQFDCSAFVPVGSNPDPRKALRDFLIDLADKAIEDHDKKRYAGIDMMQLDQRQLIDKLRNFLGGKRYFIVVDDIWKTSTWEVLKLAFVDSNCGSRIITTTRISQVSIEIGEKNIYRMKELSDNYSKKLFHTRIVGGGKKHSFNDDDELAKVSDPIIQKCSGVPLAIIAVANLLATKPIKEWPSVYKSIGLGHGDGTQVEDMKKILLISYYDLPCYLRPCLLYLSTFPEDIHIEKRDLIWRWIAEGLVHEENGKGCFDVGDSYFHELINRNMIIPIVEKASDIVYGCRVHDMVLHLIRDLSSKENFAVVLDSEPWSFAKGNINRRLAIQMLNLDTGRKKGEKIPIAHMPQVRSFKAVLCETNMIPPVCRFTVLRVLVLEFCFAMEKDDLEHIAKLLHLRYIGLSYILLSARKLPKKIGRLKFLQTLILKETGIQKLPASMVQLTRLMCLRVDDKIIVPEWIGKLTSLVELEMYHEVPDWARDNESTVEQQTLYHSNSCSTGRFVKELGKLRNLRVLKTGMTLQDEGEGRDLLESLSNLHKIQTISISLAATFLEMNVVMEPSFVLSPSLHVLELKNMKFPRLPSWINAQDLPKLYQLKVAVDDLEEHDLATLGRFVELRELGLYVIRVHRLKLAACGCGGFQTLRSFEVLVPLRFLPGAMPRLEHINFSVPVVELKDADISLDFGLGNLSSLQSLRTNISCEDASPTEVEEAEAALRDMVDTHPNHPTHEMPRSDEEKMGPDDSESRRFNRFMYKLLLEKTLEEQTSVEQDLYS